MLLATSSRVNADQAASYFPMVVLSSLLCRESGPGGARHGLFIMEDEDVSLSLCFVIYQMDPTPTSFSHSAENTSWHNWACLCIQYTSFIALTQSKAYQQPTLQGKTLLCIPFLEIAQTRSPIFHIHVSVSDLYTQDRSTYFPAAE